MLLGSRRVPPSVDEENPYWISFSDIMSGLLVIFILAALALILELVQMQSQIDRAIDELERAEEVRKELLVEVQQVLAEKNIFVLVSENSSVIHINEQVLSFGADRYEIPDNPYTKERLLEIGRVLYSAITRQDRQRYLDTVFVEGHTDYRRSLRFSEMGNWGLSTHRAIAVWNYWENTLSEERQLSTLTNYQKEPLFSVSGYAATRPIQVEQLTPAQLRANRRIDLRFTLRRADSNEFAKIRALAE